MSEEAAKKRAFVREDLGWGWLFALALGTGLLAGAVGGFTRLPQEVYSFNRALEREGVYEFYYDTYLAEPSKFSDESTLTREDRENLAKLREISKTKAPGAFGVLLMAVLGFVAVAAFVFKLGSSLSNRVAKLEGAGKPAEEAPAAK